MSKKASDGKGKADSEFKENVSSGKEEMLNGQFGSNWWSVAYQQKRVDGKWGNDTDKPKVLLVGTGKKVLNWSFENVLEFREIINDNKKEFNELLIDEREASKSDKTF